MTAPTYRADDDQLAQQHDQAVPENNLMEPDGQLAGEETNQAGTEARPTEPDTELVFSETPPIKAETDLAVAEVFLAEPDTDMAVAETPPTEADTDLPLSETPATEADTDLPLSETPPTEADTDLPLSETPPIEADTDQTWHEDPRWHAADAASLAGYESAAASVSDYPGFTADGDDGALEPGMADSSAGRPSLVSAAFTVPESAAESHLSGNGASARGPWSEIQVMFVDDPHASIERAAGLVGDRVEALIQSVRERQRSIQSAWQADDAGTEELRVALQHYRAFWNSLDDLPAQA